MGIRKIFFKKQNKENQQYNEFIEQILDESDTQKNGLEKYISKQIIKQNLDLIEQFLKSNEQYATSINQNRQEITKVVEKFTEQAEQQINEFTIQISDIAKQIKDIGKQIKELTINHTKQLLIKNDQQITKFLTRFLVQTKQENAKFLKQILQNSNTQFSKFIVQVSDIINTQNSVLIKQNTELIKQISEQTIQNHGTINKRFKELVTYQFLAAFRENLITIKTNIIILERLDSSHLNILHRLYLKYQRGHPDIPILDISRGMIIIKVLFPPFFTQILKNLSVLKSQFDDKTYTEMINTIIDCNLFFKNFNKTHMKINNIKKMLDSNIDIADKRLIELIDIN